MSPLANRWVVFAGVLTATVTACGGGGTTTATTTASTTAPQTEPSVTTLASVTSSPSDTTAAPTGPATGTFTITGDAGLDGPLTITGIRCNQPSLDGPVIGMFGTPANTDLSMLITLAPGGISLRLDTGSGTTYVERNFQGSGVAGFDTAVGAHVDSTLTPKAGETPPASLGVIMSIQGIVDCGNQQPGASTVTVTDPTAAGGFDQPLSPVRVECDTNAQGQSVQLMGIAEIGSTPTFVIVTISTDALSVAESGRTGLTHFYTAKGTGLATLSAGGAHADGDLAQQFPGGATNTVHLAGDATCGTTVVAS